MSILITAATGATGREAIANLLQGVSTFARWLIATTSARARNKLWAPKLLTGI